MHVNIYTHMKPNLVLVHFIISFLIIHEKYIDILINKNEF